MLIKRARCQTVQANQSAHWLLTRAMMALTVNLEVFFVCLFVLSLCVWVFLAFVNAYKLGTNISTFCLICYNTIDSVICWWYYRKWYQVSSNVTEVYFYTFTSLLYILTNHDMQYSIAVLIVLETMVVRSPTGLKMKSKHSSDMSAITMQISWLGQRKTRHPFFMVGSPFSPANVSLFKYLGSSSREEQDNPGRLLSGSWLGQRGQLFWLHGRVTRFPEKTFLIKTGPRIFSLGSWSHL